MSEWLIDAVGWVLLATALVIFLRRFVNELDRLLSALQRFTEHLGRILLRLWQATTSPNHHVALHVATIVLSVLLLILAWLPRPR